jgi:hypothetical protein
MPRTSGVPADAECPDLSVVRMDDLRPSLFAIRRSQLVSERPTTKDQAGNEQRRTWFPLLATQQIYKQPHRSRHARR